MRSFFRSMLDCRSVIYEKRDRAAADIYSSVEKFVRDGRYSSYRKASELATMRLSNYSEEAIAAQLSINVGTVRTHTRNVSNELYQLFGTNFLGMLSNYAEHRREVNSVMYRVKHQGEMAISYVLPEAISVAKGRQSTPKDFPMSDCSREIDFLRRYSREFLSKALEEVDIDRLMYLIDILDGKRGSPMDWNYVVSMVTGEE